MKRSRATQPSRYLHTPLIALWAVIGVFVLGSFTLLGVTARSQGSLSADADLQPVAARGGSREAPRTQFDCSQVTQIPVTECRALVDFYESTNGQNWERRDNWLVTNTPCNWFGVGCAARSNGLYVSVITMANNHLTGSIPSSIGALTGLDDLRLRNNELTGEIPDTIGNLTNLTFLSLHWNRLSGAIPKSIGLLKRLEQLYMGHNELQGTIPTSIGKLTQLEVLNLIDNQLTGPIPTSIGNVCSEAAFCSLYLEHNSLSGIIPAEFGDIRYNEYLGVTLANNKFTGIDRTNRINICRVLSKHVNSSGYWWQTQTPPLPSDPCAGVPTGVPALSD